jgi:DNA-binding MarR family transcriptional regulator
MEDMASREPDLTDQEFRVLAEFRYKLRCFLRFTERNARKAGLEPQQYQALQALRGLPDGAEPTVGFLARRLLLAHHSAGAMVDRLERKGMVRRLRDLKDRRKVFVLLAPKGRTVLRRLAVASRGELLASGPALVEALHAVLARD